MEQKTSAIEEKEERERETVTDKVTKKGRNNV